MADKKIEKKIISKNTREDWNLERCELGKLLNTLAYDQILYHNQL